ncbi:MAG: hypothetical protein M3Q71_10920 [Chloroflexota bacterium]|nr:hypothetical protein [Chloroflexota bacterium]
MRTVATPRTAQVLLRPGCSAPDIVLRDVTGAGVRLSHLWVESPDALVVVFLRHFG